MKKNIAIVAGGDSSEVVVSLKSADGIYSFIDKSAYNLYVVILKKGDWSVRLGDNLQHFAGFAFIATRDNNYLVAFFDFPGLCRGFNFGRAAE